MNHSDLSEKRLLLVGSYPPPFGGVSSFIKELEKGMADKVGQFYVLHFDNAATQVTTAPHTIIHRLPNRPNHYLINISSLGLFKLSHVFLLFLINAFKGIRLYGGALVQAMIIAAIAKKNKSNAITIFTTRAGSVIPYLHRLLPHTPIYYCVFADPFKNPYFYKKHIKWYREAMLRSRRVFSSSHYCAGVTKIFDSAIDPEVIYIGVDTNRFNPTIPQRESKQKLNLPIDKQIILTVARMEAEMGVPDILAIAEKVLSMTDNAIFVIAGAEGSSTPLVEAAAKNSGSRIVCRVNVPGDDLPHYYAASSFVIAPTVGVHACMGVSVKEAMAAGRPVIVSDSGGLPEAVQDQYNGIIVPLTDHGGVDIERFAGSIVLLINDGNTRDAMGFHSRLRAERIFSADSTLAGFMKLIATGNTCQKARVATHL